MPVKRAVRAFLWRFTTASFKAAYGRFPEATGTGGYSKNYFQVPLDVREKLDTVLGHSGTPGESIRFTWRWPDGALDNGYSVKNNQTDHRGQLYVTKGTGANKTLLTPFAPGPANDASTALDGDPWLAAPTDADALQGAIEVSGMKPWFMAVVLEGELGVLHARMILEDPPAGKEHFALSRQPAAIRNAVLSAGDQVVCLTVDIDAPAARALGIVARIEDAFARSPNVLLAGPPGCGKTVALEDMKSVYEDFPWFDTDRIDPWLNNDRKVFETAFHPGVSYETFVAGLAPKPGVGIELEVRSGPLVNMAQWCRGSGREGLLVIDEFNRGPAAAIFGDMMVLLDKGKRATDGKGGTTVAQPHSDRDIKVPDAFSAGGAIGKTVPKAFSLPAGLRILGAFNSSDRSVAALDAALLRRFAVVRIDPDPQVLADHLGLSGFDANDTSYWSKEITSWSAVDVRRLAVHLLIVLNERIAALLGEDHTLGHALLWEVPATGSREETATGLAAEFEEKIMGRLRLTLRDKDEQLAAILNVPEPGAPPGKGVAEWGEENDRIGRLVGPRLHMRDVRGELFDKKIERFLHLLDDGP